MNALQMATTRELIDELLTRKQLDDEPLFGLVVIWQKKPKPENDGFAWQYAAPCLTLAVGMTERALNDLATSPQESEQEEA